MISHDQAQELHQLIGGLLTALEASPVIDGDDAEPDLERARELAALIVFDTDPEHNRPGITLTRDQLEAWVNRPMTDEEIGWLEDSIPNSSIPDSIVTIVEANAD